MKKYRCKFNFSKLTPFAPSSTQCTSHPAVSATRWLLSLSHTSILPWVETHHIAGEAQGKTPADIKGNPGSLPAPSLEFTHILLAVPRWVKSCQGISVAFLQSQNSLHVLGFQRIIKIGNSSRVSSLTVSPSPPSPCLHTESQNRFRWKRPF